MNCNKKVLIPFLFALLTVFTIQAQRPGGGDGRNMNPVDRANKATERMVKELDLSAAQGEKVKAVNIKYAKKMVAAREEARAAEAGWEGMRATMMTLRKEQKEALSKYLTAEQAEKWEKILAERPARGPRDGKRKGKKGKKRDSKA